MRSGHHIGVCSWSLRPNSPAKMVERVRECGIGAVQLALDPLRTGDWDGRETRARCEESGIRILSGMMSMLGEDYTSLESIRATGGLRPDQTWKSNLDAANENADLARDLGLDLVTFHAGFISHDHHDPERSVLLQRLRAFADVFAARDVRVGLETGQESAATLQDVLRELDHSNVGINFDPANMILYGMGDPIAAIRLLAPSVLQCHIKDAVPAEVTGDWGAEVPVGSGAVEWDHFLQVVDRELPSCPLVIEREAGEARVEDVRTALALLTRLGVRP